MHLKKKKTVIEKLDYKTELKIKENQFKNENSLINNLNKENQLLKKILEKYSTEKKTYLNNILNQKREENKKLSNELFELKNIEKIHKNCTKEIEKLQKKIYLIKNDIKLSNQTNINEENKFNLIQTRMINTKIALKNMQENIKERKSQSISKEKKENFIIEEEEQQKKKFQDFSDNNFKKENEKNENFLTDEEVEKIHLLFKDDKLEFENFLKKITCLENYKFAQEKKLQNKKENFENNIKENNEKIKYLNSNLKKNIQKVSLFKNELNDTKISKLAMENKIRNLNEKIKETSDKNYEIYNENKNLKKVIENLKDLFENNNFDNEKDNFQEIIEKIKKEEEEQKFVNKKKIVKKQKEKNDKKFNNLNIKKELVTENNDLFELPGKKKKEIEEEN